MEYEVVKGETAAEAMFNSSWQVGDLARCVGIQVIANSDKTWTVIPQFGKVRGDNGGAG